MGSQGALEANMHKRDPKRDLMASRVFRNKPISLGVSQDDLQTRREPQGSLRAIQESLIAR